MTSWDEEFPVREEFPLAPEEFPQPQPKTEFRLPDPRAEDSPPPGGDFENPDPALEFSPPGSGRAEFPAPPAKKRRRLRRLLYGAAALALTGLLFSGTGEEEPAPSFAPPALPAEPAYVSGSDHPVPALAAEPTPESTPEPTSGPTVEPAPADKVPRLALSFFCFSHEHHGAVLMSNTAALHSVRVRVRETILDRLVYEKELSGEEMEAGRFELPVLSTGDYYMENRDALDAVNGWPEYELIVTARYENAAGDGEDTLTLTAGAGYELGIGLSYMEPDQDWSETIPPDSFYVIPWEETDEIRYVINDPDAVTDPTVISVDLSWNGNHAAAEEYEEVVERSEYTLVNSQTGEETPTVRYTRELVLRRPAWMPEEGVLHVHIVQRLASTGELWVRDYDYDYSESGDSPF